MMNLKSFVTKKLIFNFYLLQTFFLAFITKSILKNILNDHFPE